MTRPDDTRDTHWARRPERGSTLLMRLTARALRLLGRRALAPVVRLVVLYFYATGGQARRAIGQYQQRLTEHSQSMGQNADLFPARCAVYRQYLMFAEVLLDKLDVWQGKITHRDLDMDDPDGLLTQMSARHHRGQILLCAHLGNLDVCRALAGRGTDVKLVVLVHDYNAVRFNQVLAASGAANVELKQVSELDTAAMMDLSQRIERGEWLAITGDRVPLRGNRTVQVDFLGAPAALPQGPWLLAGMLRCPVNTLFCVRQEQGEKRYRLAMRRLRDQLAWTRATRDAEIQAAAQRYADRLAEVCRQTPLQWFNFYPYWNGSEHA